MLEATVLDTAPASMNSTKSQLVLTVGSADLGSTEIITRSKFAAYNRHREKSGGHRVGDAG